MKILLTLILLVFPRLLLAETIRFYYFDDDKPLSWKDEQGEARGTLIDALNVVADRAGLHFTYVSVPWARAQMMMRQGEVDAFLTIENEERRHYALFARTPMIRTPQLVYHRASDTGFAHIARQEDLEGRVQIHLLGGDTAAALDPKAGIGARSIEAMAKMLIADHGDYFISDAILMTPVLQRTGLGEKIASTSAPFLPALDFRIGLRKTFPEFRSIAARLDAAIREGRTDGAIEAALAGKKGASHDQ